MEAKTPISSNITHTFFFLFISDISRQCPTDSLDLKGLKSDCTSLQHKEIAKPSHTSVKLKE